jgi:hypothetical protein
MPEIWRIPKLSLAPHQKMRRKPFFFFELEGRPQAALAICRIASEMGESSSASAIAVFVVLRAEA